MICTVKINKIEFSYFPYTILAFWGGHEIFLGSQNEHLQGLKLPVGEGELLDGEFIDDIVIHLHKEEANPMHF